MIGIAEVSAAMTSLQAGRELLSAMVGVRDASAIADVRIQLQSMILDAQQGLMAAQQVHTAIEREKTQLEEEIVRLKDWSQEKARYELRNVSGAAFVYMQKEGMRTGEPPHWLCTNCFDRRKKSILQRVPEEGRPRERQWRCPDCKSVIGVSFTAKPTYDPTEGN